jgi:putative hydrolase of the HAD superfamily
MTASSWKKEHPVTFTNRMVSTTLVVLWHQEGSADVIRAVFFDLYYTLVRYEPPQEELEAKALEEFGISAIPEVFHRPLVAANEFMYEEIARRPFSQRSKEETMALYTQYQKIMLEEAGIEADEKLVVAMLRKMQQFKMKLVLFDDVPPALNGLKSRGLILGLISNVERDLTDTLIELGLPAWLDVVVTSLDSGFNKPQPEIFEEAMRRAGVGPSETMYVGDQYKVDCVGAAGAGMKGILLDRGGYFGQITDCLRIRSLTELAGHL